VAWQHVALVRELRVPAVSKLLLYALASRADNSDRCWPSVRRICVDTGLSRRAVQLHLARLIASGIVVRESRIGRSNRFRLVLCGARAADRNDTDSEPPKVPAVQAAERTACATPAHQVHPPAHVVRTPCARGTPEVRSEENKNSPEEVAAIVTLVDKRGAVAPWWRNSADVMRKGLEFSLTPYPGEAYGAYKDRVFTVWNDGRPATRNGSSARRRSRS
jgi:hypothetical protein